jgi:phospholipase C
MTSKLVCLLGLMLSLAASASETPNCSRPAGSLPDAKLKAGTPNLAMPIEHIVIAMQENHSFDMHLGRLNDSAFYGSDVDGITPEMFNLDAHGKPVYAYHEGSRCIMDTNHQWSADHRAWNQGRNDQFVLANGSRVMGYYDQTELPYYYALANQFAVADRYFSSAMSPTYPNRFFFLTGTAFGHMSNDEPEVGTVFSQKTIFDVLDQNHITWKYYADWQGYLLYFRNARRAAANLGKMMDYESDLKNGKLPQVVFIESRLDTESEHPPSDVAVGERWIAQRLGSLMQSVYWKSSVFFLFYDENGALFDHVAPPQACAPEAGPKAHDYERYGFRVPFIAVSPFAKHHYVSHQTYDHTSVLKFIETKFNLPALSIRDANADGLLDLFDFTHAITKVTPMPAARATSGMACHPRSGLSSSWGSRRGGPVGR